MLPTHPFSISVMLFFSAPYLIQIFFLFSALGKTSSFLTLPFNSLENRFLSWWKLLFSLYFVTCCSFHFNLAFAISRCFSFLFLDVIFLLKLSNLSFFTSFFSLASMLVSLLSAMISFSILLLQLGFLFFTCFFSFNLVFFAT